MHWVRLDHELFCVAIIAVLPDGGLNGYPTVPYSSLASMNSFWRDEFMRFALIFHSPLSISGMLSSFQSFGRDGHSSTVHGKLLRILLGYSPLPNRWPLQ